MPQNLDTVRSASPISEDVDKMTNDESIEPVDRDGTAINADKENLEKQPWFRSLFWAGLIVGAILLLMYPVIKPLWTDEVISLIWGKHTLLEMIQGHATSRDHTPTHAFFLYLARYFFGDSLAAYRIVSTLPAVFVPYIAYLLGRRINPKVGLLSLWLVALAPGNILFDRMARYHGLLALMAIWSVYLFLRAIASGKTKMIVGYALVTLGMLLVYTPSLFVVVGQFLTLAYYWKNERSQNRLKVFAAMVVCGVCLLPLLLWQTAPQGGMASGAVSVEDPAIGQGFGGFVRRVALPVYVYCVGETVYPWSWGASIPGVIIALTAFGIGTMVVRRSRDLVIPVVLIITTLMFAVATSGKIGALQTFGSMGKRDAFLIPLFCVVVATGLMSLRMQTLRIASIAILLGVWGYANFNYWTGREFLNPTYTAPWNEVWQRIDSEDFRDNAVIITDEDVIDYTLSLEQKKVPIVVPNRLLPGETAVSRALEEKGNRRYIYFIGRDRGNRMAFDAGNAICNDLSRRYTCLYEAGFMPRSVSEQYWLAKVLKRPTPAHYIWVKRFDTLTPSAQSVEAKVHLR